MCTLIGTTCNFVSHIYTFSFFYMTTVSHIAYDNKVYRVSCSWWWASEARNI